MCPAPKSRRLGQLLPAQKAKTSAVTAVWFLQVEFGLAQVFGGTTAVSGGTVQHGSDPQAV